MIKANDLRIGNWINYKGGSVPVTMVGMYGIQSKTDESLINASFHTPDLTPIPLTPEILEKLGFKDRKMALGLLVFQVNEKDTADVYDPYVHASGVDFPCKYLHQLQNIYFSLMGEELTINL